jgi:hypothetical protein
MRVEWLGRMVRRDRRTRQRGREWVKRFLYGRRIERMRMAIVAVENVSMHRVEVRVEFRPTLTPLSMVNNANGLGSGC